MSWLVQYWYLKVGNTSAAANIMLPMQLVGIFCKGLLPGLLPLVWSIAILKVLFLY